MTNIVPHECPPKNAMWASGDVRIAVRSECEWHDDGQFDLSGLKARRPASINDKSIDVADRHSILPARD